MEQFTYVKRGYDPEEVDKYITTLEQVVKSYKDKDNAIKNALISAQAAADNVLRGAQAQAESYKVQISEQLVDMRATLDRQRASLQKFQEGYTNVVKMCIQELQQFNMGEMFARLDEMDEAIADLQGLEALSGGKDNLLPHDTTKDSRGYGRDAMQDIAGPRGNLMRDSEPMRDFTREAPMRSDRRESMFDDDRDVMSQDMMQVPPEPMRDMGRGRVDAPPPYEPMRDTLRSREEPTPYEPMRDISRGRDEMPPPYEPIRDMGRDMRDPGRDMMRDPGLGRDMMRDAGRDFMPEPMRDPGRDMRSDAGRDIRRDMGRDMRSDTGRAAGRYSAMRDTAMDTMRMDTREPMREPMREREPMRDMREPMRDMGRQFMPEANPYGDDDQNLLPPVASLM